MQTRDIAKGACNAQRLHLRNCSDARAPSRSNNQMFSKFNAMGLNNLIQESLTKGNDITSDIESKLKNGG